MPDGTLPTTIVHLDPKDIDPSPTNPRKNFDKAKLEELAADVKVHGIIQPVTVRAKGKDRHELVVGERRWRAAKIAGVKVPAICRVLDDATVIEIQLVENAQREDVHPLEEAEAYEQLHRKHGRSVEEIAAKVSKSKGFVYARMKLLALTPDARQAYYDGKLSSSTALYVARVPASLQGEALKALEPRFEGDDAPSAREAFEIIEDKFMLRLADAPFDRADVTLLPRAGSCATCPKRTGNQAELFSDVKSADVCTDPICFREKSDAGWVKTREAAKAAGQTVIEGKEAKKLLPYAGSMPQGFLSLDAKNYEDRKTRTNREILGKKELPPVTLIRTDEGKVLECVPVQAVRKVLAKSKPPEPAQPAGPDRAKEKYSRLVDVETMKLATAAIVKKAEGAAKRVAMLRIVVAQLGIDSFEVLVRRGVEEKLAQEDSGAEMLKLCAAARHEDELFGILAEISIGEFPSLERKTGALAELVKLYGIDVAALKKKAAAEVKVEQATGQKLSSMPTRDAKAVSSALSSYEKKAAAAGARHE